MGEKADDKKRDEILRRLWETRPEPRKTNPFRSKKKAKKITKPDG